MKIRVTLLTENDKQLTPEVTEENVRASWELLFSMIEAVSNDPSEKATVEKVEILE